MAVQLISIIKAVGPYIAQIAAAAIPVFTSKSGNIQSSIKQIEELQSAVTKNAESIQVLAEKIQETIHGIELAAINAKKETQIYKAMFWLSLIFSSIALVTCIYLLTK
jgi:uncharacterized membrane protein